MALWTPAQLLTALWLDGADADTIEQNVGRISRWVDKSGHGRDAVQDSASLRPDYLDADLGATGAVGLGQNQYMDIAHADWGSTVTMIAVARTNKTKPGTSTDNIGTIFDCSTHQSFASSRGLRFDTGGNGYRFGIATANHAGFLQQDRHGRTSYFIRCGVYDGATARHAVDGGVPVVSQEHSGSIVWPTSPLSRIGQFTSSSLAFYLDGAVAELIILPSAVLTEEEDLLVGYLAHKWGLVSNLPSDHPYKFTAPRRRPYDPFRCHAFHSHRIGSAV